MMYVKTANLPTVTKQLDIKVKQTPIHYRHSKKQFMQEGQS